MSDIGPETSGQLATTGERKDDGEKLEEKQEAALDLLRMGITVAETARTTGVSRGTIYHWLRHDPVFGAAYNRWHDEMEKGAQFLANSHGRRKARPEFPPPRQWRVLHSHQNPA